MSELSRETESLLERGRAGMPLTAAHQARLRTAILAKAAGTAVVTTTASAAAWTSLGVKIGGALVMVAAAGGVGAAIEARVSNRPPTPSTTLASSSGENHATPPSWLSSTRTPTTPSSAATPQTAASTTAPPSTATYPALQLWQRKVPAPQAHIASTSTLAWRGTSSSIATPVPASSIVAELPTSPVPTQGALPASGPIASLARDVRLLRDADLAIKGGDPERALDLLDEHATAFPRSDLEPERSAERVFALCRAGRLEESRNAASAFLSAHPTGPLAARVKRACRGGAL
jgi:hypothetical protein